MDTRQRTIAQACLEGAEQGTRTFPQIIAALLEGGFDGYLVDLRLGQATYYLPSGDSLELPMQTSAVSVAAEFDLAIVRAAIGEAQALVPGYTYAGFCDKVKHAGCAGYLVSFVGRRVLYFGRTGETHVEHFPSPK